MKTFAFLPFPDPFSFKLLEAVVSPLVDLGTKAVGGVADSILGEILGGLSGAVVGALVDMVASILEFFWDASEPELTSAWFYGPDAPYRQMVLLSMPLLVVFTFAGIIQGVLKGDTAGMMRMVLLRLPGAVVAMSIAIVLADLLIKVTDDMSRAVLANFREDIEQVGTVLLTLQLVPGAGLASSLLLLVFGLVGLLASVVLVVQLFVRGSLIYLIAALSPLIFAASVWESMRDGVRRLCEMAFALIISKLAVAVALAVSSAALVGSWPGHDNTEIPTPELTAAQAEQSATQSVGILLSAVVMFVVAAFMPWVVFRLVPMAEGALVSQGIQGGPLRAFQSASATGNSLAYNPAASALRAARAAAGRSSKGKGEKGGDSDGDNSPSSGPARRKPGSNKRSRAGSRRIGNVDDVPPHRPGTSSERPTSGSPGKHGSRKQSGPGSPRSRPASGSTGRRVGNFDDVPPHPGSSPSPPTPGPAGSDRPKGKPSRPSSRPSSRPPSSRRPGRGRA